MLKIIVSLRAYYRSGHMISQNTFFFTANTFHGSYASGILLSALNSTRSMPNSSKQIAAIKICSAYLNPFL
jgi:hypothetical protein